MQKALLWALLFCCASSGLFAQTLLKGQVTAPDGTPLPFVNIMVNEDPQRGLATDIDGRFIWSGPEEARQFRLSYVGYQDRVLQLDTINTEAPWQIILHEQAYDFAAVEVIAGINFADVIMRKVIRNRHLNDPENLETYQCKTYNKVIMSWLPQQEAYEKRLAPKDPKADTTVLSKRQARMLRLMQSTETHHLLMMESLTERLFRHPVSYAETILANKVSGFSEAPFAALANDVQPFSFYQEEVILLDKAFLNPISPGSPERYFFHVEDTLYRQQDTVYLITFHPRKQKNFNGLKGVLYINTDRYAVQNIIAEPSDTGLIHFRIEQLYDRPDGQQWFPAQLNYQIQLPKYPHPNLGLQISGKSYISEVRQNLVLEVQPFQRADHLVFADSAFVLPERDWQKYRQEPLDSLERNTYILVDSLGEKLHFDKWVDRLDALGRGRWPLGVLDLALPKLLQFNSFEELRLGLGLYTSDQVASWFTVGAYAGYGIKDQQWKYGAEVQFFSDWDKRWEWRWYYQKDISETGGQLFPLTPNFLSRRFYADRMDEEERYGTFFRTSPLRFLQIGVEASHTNLVPLYPYFFRKEVDASPVTDFRFTEAALYIHYAYGQHYRRILGNWVPDGKEIPYPSFSLSLKKGFGQQLKGAFPYWQIWVAVDQSFRLIRLGKTTYRMEAAMTQGMLPASRLYSSPGFGRDFQWLTLGNVFQTMEPYEFLSDRYISFFFRQELGRLLFKTKWLKPSISLEHHFTIGHLSQPQRHEGIIFKTPAKGFAEAGLIIDDLIRINYLNFTYLGLGGGAYYRYGAYQLPGGVGESLAFRLSLSLDF